MKLDDLTFTLATATVDGHRIWFAETEKTSGDGFTPSQAVFAAIAVHPEISPHELRPQQP